MKQYAQKISDASENRTRESAIQTVYYRIHDEDLQRSSISLSRQGTKTQGSGVRDPRGTISKYRYEKMAYSYTTRVNDSS